MSMVAGLGIWMNLLPVSGVSAGEGGRVSRERARVLLGDDCALPTPPRMAARSAQSVELVARARDPGPWNSGGMRRDRS